MTTDEASLINEIVETHVATMRERYTDDLELLLALSDSPIERVFGAALLHELYAATQLDAYLHEGDSGPDKVADCNINAICPQYTIGRYVVDFFVFIRTDRGAIKIAIECDGHDFHERTKEQARRDRQKDRWLQANGYMVLRFTGSEIWKDPIGCAAQVLRIIHTKVFF